MKRLILFSALLLAACSPSKSDLELRRVRDSINIVNHLFGRTPNHSRSEPSEEEKQKMEQRARFVADSIASAIGASMNQAVRGK